MKILVLGSSGLVGSGFVESTKFKSAIINPSSEKLDITNHDEIQNVIKEKTPDVIINFAAYTNVSEGENQRGDKKGDCWKINVDGVSNILNSLGQNAKFIQISTDYVFPGLKNDGEHNEELNAEHDSNKLTWYGYTKAEAEQNVIEKLKDKAIILRLVYPVRAKFEKKLDFVRKPLKLFDEGKLYPLFTDQQISISSIKEISLALDKIIEKEVTGTFHASSSDLTSPFELISYLLQKARNKNNAVKPASLVEFLKTGVSPVRYPQFGGLKVSLTEKKLGLKFSTWKEIIDKLIEEGIEN